MRNDFRCPHWTTLGLVLAIMLSTGTYLLVLYADAGVLWMYITVDLLIALFFVVPTFILKKTHDLHIHHTSFGSIGVIGLAYQNPLITFLHGISNGVMIEGGAKWGYDPIWNKKGQVHDCEYSPIQNPEV